MVKTIYVPLIGTLRVKDVLDEQLEYIVSNGVIVKHYHFKNMCVICVLCGYDYWISISDVTGNRQYHIDLPLTSICQMDILQDILAIYGNEHYPFTYYNHN